MFRLAALLCCLALPLRAETALVAVAANFASVAEELVAAFAADSGHKVVLTTGSTGKLFAQISNGAPFDLFLSADAATPERLHGLGHAAPFPYAFGRLVLWVPGVAPDTPPETALANARHIAIANPALAPYGIAATEALDAMGLTITTQPRIVMGGNIGQAFALVATGAAEAGFVAASALPADAQGLDAQGLIWQVTQTLYAPIRQDAIVLTHGAENAAATGFAAYLQSPAAKAVIQNHGYGVPQ
jgi:molybdate transport system substrate-binding protein